MTEPTDAEIVSLMRDGNNCNYNDEAEHIDYARAVLAKWGQPAQAGEREQERIAFKDAHRHLELYEVPDAWGRPMFKHSHVEASWLGWIARASHGQAQAGSVPAVVRDYPPLPQQVAWRDAVEHCDLYWRPVVQEHNDLEPLFTKQQMRAYVDADRAAHAPADSVQEDAARYRWLTADHHKQEDRIRVYEIATSMNVRGKGHIDAAIDAARKQGGA